MARVLGTVPPMRRPGSGAAHVVVAVSAMAMAAEVEVVADGAPVDVDRRRVLEGHSPTHRLGLGPCVVPVLRPAISAAADAPRPGCGRRSQPARFAGVERHHDPEWAVGRRILADLAVGADHHPVLEHDSGPHLERGVAQLALHPQHWAQALPPIQLIRERGDQRLEGVVGGARWYRARPQGGRPALAGSGAAWPVRGWSPASAR